MSFQGNTLFKETRIVSTDDGELSNIKIMKTENMDESNSMDPIARVNTSTNGEPINENVFSEIKEQQENRINLSITNKILCSNCDTSFSTKYQYQRHECKLDTEKIVLQSEIPDKDLNKPTRLKFVCGVCKTSFVSQNRLKNHKKYHCKKAEDTTKYYRNDVAVWRCEQCKQIFATNEGGKEHIKQCPTVRISTPTVENENNKMNISEHNNFESNFENAILNQSGSCKEISDTLGRIITRILYQCEFCNRTYAERTAVLNHQKTHTTEKNYECIYCNQHFISYCQATVHWQSKCNSESNSFYLPKIICCEHCNKDFKSHEVLYTHKNKKKHFTPRIQSRIDKKPDVEIKSVTEQTIAKMIVSMIAKLNQTADTINNENDQNENNLLGRIRGETDEFNSKYEKKKRGREREWQNTEVNNEFEASEGCQYQCEKCAAAFESTIAMDIHKETTHASTYRCEQCEQIVHSEKALTVHCRAHQSIKPYVCDQCGRSFSRNSNLWQHMRFHLGIKPFACPHEGCEARYTIHSDLKDHIRSVHTRERPFKCSVCNKCFLTESTYYQHRLIHTNDRRYECEICNKRFLRSSTLNIHKKIHTGERPYPCPVCGRQFTQKANRNKHVHSQHSL